ncbi:beta-propeller fold lactonase family protein [Pedobacter sp. SL55]|uniref:beta-propeller fold lactonase family protein n=1 Tax=Pedobacter sp. SL55 TaxID=2995161 RepID=UPI00226E41C2|nr:beta-propeller fold lactonase family protein [Pedobacter sp. SL55]WAC41296.1 beta-propeller fold lactonase family protein [Pedobacter sp. SL55]
MIDSAALQPIANFDVAVSYRGSGKNDFTSVGTEKTDASGRILMSLPWPSTVKAKVAKEDVYKTDSAFVLHKDDVGSAITLKISTLVGLDVNVFDFLDKQYIQGANVKFSIKKQGESAFSLLETKTVSAAGKASVLVAFPSEVKVEISGLKFFKDTVININVPKFATQSLSAPLYLKPAAYTEPVMTNLQVTTLALNNGITLADPQDVTTDRKGNIYITEGNTHRVIKVDANGNTSVLAGTGTAGKTDGAGATATFAFPYGIKVANNGAIYVANNNGSGSTAFHAIRRIDIAPNGAATVTTIAGSGTSGTADGVGTAATFNRPAGLAIDKANRYLYAAEWGSARVRRIDLTNNQVSFIATTGANPWGVAIDEDSQNLYVAAWNGNSISKINLANNSITAIRSGATTNFKSPRGIYVSSQGKIVVSNFDNPGTGQGHYLSMVNSLNETGTSTFSLVAGATASGDALGAANSARFNGPIGIWYDKYTGNWYVADVGNKKIKVIRSSDL